MPPYVFAGWKLRPSRNKLHLSFIADSSSFHLQKREAEEKTVLTQIQEAAQGYWDQVSDKANDLIEKVKDWDIQEKVR